MIFSAILIFLAGLAWLAGWGLHALVAGSRSSPPTPSSTPAATSSPSESKSTATATLTTSQKTVRATSTPAPTSSPTPWGDKITVLPDEGLYQVCRRHCPGRFDGPNGSQKLDAYARRVAERNHLRWSGGNAHVEPGQELDMPPCP